MYDRLRSHPVTPPAVPVKPVKRRIHVTSPRQHAKHVTEAVNWGVHKYIPAECNLDPFVKPRQIGVMGISMNRGALVQFTVALIERLQSAGVRSVRIRVVAQGGWVHEQDTLIGEALKLAIRFKDYEF